MSGIPLQAGGRGEGSRCTLKALIHKHLLRLSPGLLVLMQGSSGVSGTHRLEPRASWPCRGDNHIHSGFCLFLLE